MDQNTSSNATHAFFYWLGIIILHNAKSLNTQSRNDNYEIGPKSHTNECSHLNDFPQIARLELSVELEAFTHTFVFHCSVTNQDDVTVSFAKTTAACTCKPQHTMTTAAAAAVERRVSLELVGVGVQRVTGRVAGAALRHDVVEVVDDLVQRLVGVDEAVDVLEDLLPVAAGKKTHCDVTR